MSKIERLTAEIMELPQKDRVKIAGKIYESLDDDFEVAVDPEIEEAWLVEAERRECDLKSGKIKGIPGDEVFRMIRERKRKSK